MRASFSSSSCGSLATADGRLAPLSIEQHAPEGLPHALDLVEAVHRCGSGAKRSCLLSVCVKISREGRPRHGKAPRTGKKACHGMVVSLFDAMLHCPAFANGLGPPLCRVSLNDTAQ